LQLKNFTTQEVVYFWIKYPTQLPTAQMTTALTPEQLNDIVIIERVCSILSLVGCAFILITFVFFRGFRKPINRLVFYASVGNVLTNIATLLGRSGTTDIDGFLCQAQGFLIQT
jgi:hypothetical protein